MNPLLPKWRYCENQLVIRENHSENVISSRMKEYKAQRNINFQRFEKKNGSID